MTTTAASRKIDDLVTRGRTALQEGHAFEAEQAYLRALEASRAAGDFLRMADLVGPLWDARRCRLEAAFAEEFVTILAEPVTEDAEVEPGCYLVRPPHVGADARRLRLAALQQEVPVAVLCREPTTQLGLCPIVAICPGTTVRTKIDPPEDPEAPDLEWFTWAMEQLGDWAVSTLDPELEIVRRVDALLNNLNAIPDHEGLHVALEEACRLAAGESADEPRP